MAALRTFRYYGHPVASLLLWNRKCLHFYLPITTDTSIICVLEMNENECK